MWIRAAFVGLLVVLGLPILGTPAHAAEDYLQITKTVDESQPEPGQTFTYTIQVTCSEADCLDAQLTDTLPTELAGFDIVNVVMTPSTGTIPRTVTWNPGGTSVPPTEVGTDTGFVVDMAQVTDDPVGVGLINGQTLTVQISLRVPDDYPAGVSADIVNTAHATASNANPVQDSATVNIQSPTEIAVNTTKTWTPASQAFNPGAASNMALGVTNTSNAAVNTMAIQDPKAAPDGAANLDATNPFTITNFTGFSGVSLPAGCTNVQVDAYVLSGGTWSWVEGNSVAAPTLNLPAGVANDDVGGIRITCTGTMAPNAQMSVDVGLAQRATHRNDGSDLSTAQHRVNNVAVGSVSVTGGDAPVTGDATDDYTVLPSVPSVEATKDISPNRITAGQTSVATLSVSNGAVPVTEMTVSDLDFFTDEVTFGGFTSAPSWPAGATAATITYYPLDGGASVTTSFADGATPNAPGMPISGFAITWTGDAIQANAPSQIVFDIDTTEDAVGDLSNTVDAEVTAANGLTGEDSDTDTLTIINPSVDVTLNKSVRPSTAVEPGEQVIASLETNATAQGDGVTLDTIVVEDSWADGANEFWNAFDLQAIAPTQVPGGTTLVVAVQGPDGVWHDLPAYGPQTGATVFQMTNAELATALDAFGLTPEQAQGIRFTYTNADFPADVTVTPNIVYSARSTQRDGGAVTPGDDQATSYQNTATAQVEGESAGGKSLDDDDTDVGQGTVITHEGGPGPADITKNWVESSVNAQSSQQATSNLTWNVAEGLGSVTISDPASGYASPAGTVFDAFDLVQINPIAASSEPYSNGWYLKYDTITAVQLFNSITGSWETVTTPAAGWINASGAFVGYTLSAAERSRTTGVRLVLEPNDAARTAAQQTGASFDPFAPAPGSGVGWGSADRTFSLTWQVRDQKRSDGSFVVGDEQYNTADEGIVDNTTSLDGVPLDGSAAVRDTDNDTIQILDPEPGVAVDKSVTAADPIFVPMPDPGTSAADYPTASWQMVAHNTSTARASYVRVTDPATCSDTALGDCQTAATAAGATGNPFVTDGSVDYLTDSAMGTPFDRFNLTGINIAASIPGQVDLSQSVVWLLRYQGGTYTAEQTTAAAVNAMLTNPETIVGISVTFQGADPASTGGTITQDNLLSVTMSTQLRTTLRSSGADQVLSAGQNVEVPNRVFAQSYDPVTSPGTVTGDVDDAQVNLTGGDINITPTKSVSPGVVYEADPDAPVTVTLGANQGSNPRSTLPPSSVVIEDQADSVGFWNTFQFTGLGAITLPAGADRVQVDVYGPFGAGGALGWATGTPAASTPEVPVAEASYPDIQGIRITYTRADGGYFSGVPAANWSASAVFTVEVRDTYLDSGDPVEFEGTYQNSQTSQAIRRDGNNSEEKATGAQIELSHGTREIAVHKLTNEGNRLASVGDTVPFALTFENTGTGVLTVTELRDVLPPELVYTGSTEPTYTAEPSGTLSENVTVSSSADGRTLTFTWPTGGRTMQPGETFEIILPLELQPGLSAGETATNTMTVQTEEELSRCTNIQAGGSTTEDYATDPHTCGTTDYVGVITGPNLFTVKGVRGSLDSTADGGAYNPNSGASCAPTLTATPGDTVAADGRFYRAPCVSHSTLGGTDDWVLHAANAGTVNVDRMIIFDQLPVAGDSSLISGAARGSQYRPQIVPGSLKVTAPNLAGYTIETTSSPNVCVGTWANLQNQAPCEQNGEVWTAASGSTDWSQVTGLRITMDFGPTAAGALAPGQTVDVNFSTINVPMTAGDPSGASTEVPGTDEFAWNQFGVKYHNANAANDSKIAPSRVGVHLRFGSIQIDKRVTGAAASHAPDQFLVDVACTFGSGADQVPLDLGDDAVVELNDGNGYSHRIDGIPLGSECTVAEQGDVGEFGETSRDGTPTTLQVTEPTDPTQPVDEQDVPSAQIATITNDYQFSGLSVTKHVDTEATGASFGPFQFTLACTDGAGDPIDFDGDGTTLLEFSLDADETFTAPENTIPVGATCDLAETDSFFADNIVITGDNVVDNGDGTATVTPGTEPAEVVVTNAYDAGTLTLTKVVDGQGADLYGAGPFTFDVLCTYQGQDVFDDSIELARGGSSTLGPYPVGTTCVVSETGTGGASASVLDPEDGTVVIPAPDQDGGTTQVAVTATNTFDLTGFEVDKKIVGALDAPGAHGPFTVRATCTWLVDGDRVAFDVPGGADRVLSARNDYHASYHHLPSSARCTVKETDTGGADSTTVRVKGGDDGAVKSGTSVNVDLAGTQTGGVSVLFTNRFVDESDTNNGHHHGNDGHLPGTGSDISPWMLWVGGLLLALGAAGVYAGRRRRTG
ncbi:MAG: DUF5979 domain-containing protein [Nocardioides sp.]|uniref:DUF5979 domain-containing protein n=1 Tax=Nocardioides sp. TaxID=35761 RepID=UPI0039E44B04